MSPTPSAPDEPEPTLLPSEEEKEEFRQRLEHIDCELREDRALLEKQVDEWLRKTAGPHLETLSMNRDHTERFLDNPDPRLREVALYLAANHWGPIDRYAARYEQMALNDADIGVRGLAICYLGSCYSDTADRRIGQILAKIIADKSEPEALRVDAYKALICVHGYRSDVSKRLVGIVDGLPDDIDWLFVEDYLCARDIASQ